MPRRALALLLLPCLAPADPAPEPATETIVVTASFTPQPLDRVGSSVSVVDAADIEVRQNAVAAEALRSVPGLSIARSGPVGAQTQLRMRGAEANQVLVLIDGVEANDPATDDSFSFEHLTTFDIERIEVVRGPQSALWGSDALAGVVSIVTRRPERPLETAAFLEGGTFGYVNGGARIGGAGAKGSLVASASRFDSDGTNAANAGSEEDGYDNTSGQIAGRYALTPALGFDASVRHTDATADYDSLDYVDGRLVPVDADNHTDVTQDYARGGLTLDLLESRWTHALHYAVTSVETDTRAEDGMGGFTHASTQGDKYAVRYQTSYRLLPDHAVTLAIDHEREEFSQRAADTGFGDPNQDQSLDTTGYAAEYAASFGALALSASARHDDNSDFGDVNTWRTTASWSVAPDTRLHGSFGTGQKSPTFFERFGYTPDTFVGNPDLDPETSQGWDLGLEQRLLDGRLRADVTYFRADLDDEINGFYCPPPTFACTAVNEDGTSHRKGVEATLEAEIADGYSVQASYTYTDASDPGGAREVRRPLNSAGLNLTGRWMDGRLTANAGAYYTGDREDDAFLLDAPYVTRVTLDAYTLVNLAVSCEVAPGVSLYGRVENALDEDYEDVYGFNTPGAGVFVGVRAGFNR